MAEALAVAASGIAIAQISAQVGGAVFKLKQLWEEVKDVPDDIADLMEQIDCLSPVLWEAENNFNQGDLPPLVWDRLASTSNTLYCRKALQSLTAMVDELNHHINSARKGRRKIAAVKVLLKKDSLKKMEKRLENAIRMLTLAQQSYLVALTKVQPDIIIQRFATLTLRGDHWQTQQVTSESTPETRERTALSRPPKWPDEKNIIARPRRGLFAKPTRPGIFGKILVDSFASGHAILLQAPAWLSQRSWELHSIKANGDWKFYLRSYSLIPQGSEIVKLVRKGSPNDMQKLFDAGLASPYDRDQFGYTLLHRASHYQNFQVINYLIDIGVSSFERDNYGKYPADSMLISSELIFDLLLSDKTLAKRFLVFSRLNYLGDEDDEEIQISHTECNCRYGMGDLEMYRALLPYQCPSHTNTSLESRMDAVDQALKSDYCSPEVIKAILEPELSNKPQAIRCSIPSAIITSVALAMGHSCVYVDNQDWSVTGHGFFCSDKQDWFTFAVDVIRLTPDLHVTSELPAGHWKLPGNTALMCIASGFVFEVTYIASETHHFSVKFAAVLNFWLEALKFAGVDLDAYGYREHEIFVGHDNHRFEVHYYRSPGDSEELPFSAFDLVGFRFGPDLEDWEFYWNEPTDEFAGDFWDLIENPPLHIPGSWVD
ncbi:hypothetical protein F4781DRAFT_213381 [Annulohypoxylon bovei var. microspora]|nr:hypothetical protein F4781DRAFT_213381 [Annulohypoxylon bovei var. microspora]